MSVYKYEPKCPDDRKECFACGKDGKCRILKDVKGYRINKFCPFYRHKDEVDLDRMCEEIKVYASKKGEKIDPDRKEI